MKDLEEQVGNWKSKVYSHFDHPSIVNRNGEIYYKFSCLK